MYAIEGNSGAYDAGFKSFFASFESASQILPTVLKSLVCGCQESIQRTVSRLAAHARLGQTPWYAVVKPETGWQKQGRSTLVSET